MVDMDFGYSGTSAPVGLFVDYLIHRSKEHLKRPRIVAIILFCIFAVIDLVLDILILRLLTIQWQTKDAMDFAPLVLYVFVSFLPGNIK